MSCSGCSACAVVCPKKCIVIKRNKKGFFHPFREKEWCSHCGLCKEVCPFRVTKAQALDDGVLYSAYVIDSKIRKTASSGGIASYLADCGIDQGYGICGVALNYESMEAEHQIITDKSGILDLRGSKYLQSNCVKAFSAMLDELRKNVDNKFMVFGTPCQIVGLRKVLLIKGMIDRVILVDIFCHGVPSNLLWEKYKDWIVKKMKLNSIQDVKKVIFRDKHYSWHTYYMNILCGGGGGM